MIEMTQDEVNERKQGVDSPNVVMHIKSIDLSYVMKT